MSTYILRDVPLGLWGRMAEAAEHLGVTRKTFILKAVAMLVETVETDRAHDAALARQDEQPHALR